MSDAAGDVRTGGRNLTVGHRQRRASGRLAAAGLRHNGDIPDAVIGLLGEGGSGGRCGQANNKKSDANAIETHESNP